MSTTWTSWVSPENLSEKEKVDALLAKEGIRRDQNLDYTCGMYDGETLLATGSCFGNTLRCLAVDSAHQGEGLMNQLLTHLLAVQWDKGNHPVFLYTKCSTAKFFGGLGFYEIARVREADIVFMENCRGGFEAYQAALLAESPPPPPRTAALVMNANPFTNGHRHLVETAAGENDLVHLFVVSEDVSAFPFAVRRRLVQEGTAHLPNVLVHDSGPYIISSATFPSYFQKDALSVVESHARLDLAVFGQIARSLGITARYVGEEPQSEITNVYNRMMAEELPRLGIGCTIIPRKEVRGLVISASTVRRALREGDWGVLPELVPPTTLRYLQSPEAIPVLQKMK